MKGLPAQDLDFFEFEGLSMTDLVIFHEHIQMFSLSFMKR
jgi:hypothetical protein